MADIQFMMSRRLAAFRQATHQSGHTFRETASGARGRPYSRGQSEGAPNWKPEAASIRGSRRGISSADVTGGGQIGLRRECAVVHGPQPAGADSPSCTVSGRWNGIESGAFVDSSRGACRAATSAARLRAWINPDCPAERETGGRRARADCLRQTERSSCFASGESRREHRWPP